MAARARWHLETAGAVLATPGILLCNRSAPPMLKLNNLWLGALALFGASVPLAAFAGFVAPACRWSSVWSFTGIHYQFVCF
jgi:hypothetical protein